MTNYDVGFDLDELPDPTDLELEQIELELVTGPDLEIEAVYEGTGIDFSSLSFRAERIA